MPNEPSFAIRSWLGTYLTRDAEGKLGATSDANKAPFVDLEKMCFECLSRFPKSLIIKSAKGVLCATKWKMELREKVGSYFLHVEVR